MTDNPISQELPEAHNGTAITGASVEQLFIPAGWNGTEGRQPPLYTAAQVAALAGGQPAQVEALSAAQAGVPADEDEALDLLAEMFDAWENGPQCYEEPESQTGYLGQAFMLDHVTFHRCADLLNRRRPSKKAAPQPQAPAAQGDAVLAYLDGLSDDAAAHIFPDDLRRCSTSECTATVYSVRVGSPDGKTVPLYSREQVAAAIAAQAKETP